MSLGRAHYSIQLPDQGRLTSYPRVQGEHIHGCLHPWVRADPAKQQSPCYFCSFLPDRPSLARTRQPVQFYQRQAEAQEDRGAKNSKQKGSRFPYERQEGNRVHNWFSARTAMYMLVDKFSVFAYLQIAGSIGLGFPCLLG